MKPIYLFFRGISRRSCLVQPVPDPRRFGVVELGAGGYANRLIEKPKELSNNLAVVGFYYFRSGEDLIAAVEEQFKRDIHLGGEYFLTDALNIMLERGTRMRTQQVNAWLDGYTRSLLETNRYLLDHGHENSVEAARGVRCDHHSSGDDTGECSARIVSMDRMCQW